MKHFKEEKEAKTTNVFIDLADKENPMIECPTNQTVDTDLGLPTAVVKWDEPKATDNSGEAVNVSCTPTAGSNFTIGQHEVVCAAVDKSGNKGSCAFNVTIIGT